MEAPSGAGGSEGSPAAFVTADYRLSIAEAGLFVKFFSGPYPALTRLKAVRNLGECLES